jgi:Thioesterase-like superfamily
VRRPNEVLALRDLRGGRGPVTLEWRVPSAYYQRLDADRFQPTDHVQGAWNHHEQHMAPVSGLLAHALERHAPRHDLVMARVTYEILGLIPLELTTVKVRTIRPGRTIELLEAVASVGGRDVVRAQAWRLATQDTSAVAGGLPRALPARERCTPFGATATWPGGYIRSIEVLQGPEREPGAGQAWLRTALPLVEGEPVTPTAAFLGLVDTANGMNVRLDPREWAFPNVELSVHLYRTPQGGPGRWVGFDTLVTVGGGGVGLTSSTLHDELGPVGQAEQLLTVRPRARNG